MDRYGAGKAGEGGGIKKGISSVTIEKNVVVPIGYTLSPVGTPLSTN
jgi:hypothetical protein